MRSRIPSALATLLIGLPLASCQIERVSIGSAGEQGNQTTYDSAISRDGRYVAFESQATNLVPGDGIDDDIFLRDRATGQTVLVSKTGQDAEASTVPAISADGRFVAFDSIASTLVPGDTNHREDVFVWDRETGAIKRVSVSSTGAQADDASVVAPSPEGRISLSRNGRYVAFNSYATNLASADGNGLEDVFVRDTVAGTTVRIPAEATGEAAIQPDGSKMFGIGEPALTFDGGRLAFVSVRYLETPFGLRYAREGTDVYVHDFDTGATTRLTGGTPGQGRFGIAISGNGRRVAFTSADDLLVRDLDGGTTRRVPVSAVGDPDAVALRYPSLSRTGRFVAFTSDSGFVRGANVYVHDFRTGETRPLTGNVNHDPALGYNTGPRLSANGRFVSWVSTSSYLVPGDTNGVADAFVADLREP